MIAAATFSTSVEISATEKNFYSVEKFADLEILRYKVPGFEDLTPKQKELVYYLSQAALQGRDILYDQNGKWNLAIRRTLEAVYTQYKGDRNNKDFKALEKYLKQVWFANGIHHHTILRINLNRNSAKTSSFKQSALYRLSLCL